MTPERLQRLVVRAPISGFRIVRREARAFTAGLRFGLAGRMAATVGLRRPEPVLQQAIRSFKTPLPSMPHYQDLRSEIERRKLRWTEGTWTLYLPPQPGLHALLGPVVEQYPDAAGWKILKDFKSAESARYIPRDRNGWAERPGISYADFVLAGTSHDQLVRGNVLHLYGIGPRVCDVVTLTANGSALTAFVVKHVEGGPPTAEELADLVARVERRVEARQLGLASPNWRRSRDFQPPDCNGNAIRDADTGEVLYVDFQAFLVPERRALVRSVLTDEARRVLHFGTENITRGGRYLYQSIPDVFEGGKRDTVERWEIITRLLQRSGVDLAGRPVFDIGCNAGMILANALAAGASWGVGWDRPEVIRHARELMMVLGFTRVDLHGVALDPTYRLIDDVPAHVRRSAQPGIVFYLAMVKHVGFLKGLADLPWRAMVYEGNEIHRLSALEKDLADLRALCRFRIAEAIEYTDGEGRPRPLAILVREA